MPEAQPDQSKQLACIIFLKAKCRADQRTTEALALQKNVTYSRYKCVRDAFRKWASARCTNVNICSCEAPRNSAVEVISLFFFQLKIKSWSAGGEDLSLGQYVL